MLSILGSVKILVNKDDPRDYRDADIKRTMVTVIEYIFVNGRSFLLIIIWLAITYRSNWIIYLTSGWHYAYFESEYIDFKIRIKWLKRVFDL
jgi:hypothetical protein